MPNFYIFSNNNLLKCKKITSKHYLLQFVLRTMELKASSLFKKIENVIFLAHKIFHETAIRYTCAPTVFTHIFGLLELLADCQLVNEIN